MAGETSAGLLDKLPIPPDGESTVADGDAGDYINIGLQQAALHANEAQDPAAADAVESTHPATELVGGRGYTVEDVKKVVGAAVVGGWQSGLIIENDPTHNRRVPRHNSQLPPVLGRATLASVSGRGRPPSRPW